MKKFQNVFAAIKTGLLTKATSITIIGSKAVIDLLKTFEKDGLIRGFQIVNLKTFKICIYLKYKQDMTSIISSIKSISTTKEKMYLKGRLIKKINNTLNMYFVSTKAGLHTLPQVKRNNKKLKNAIGGEVKYIVEINKVNNNLKELRKK
jgi:ribosomal protein S8